jgi:uncharacterized protein
MTNFIPIFPLGIVVFPGETLNLHIFEPRYKQLITECHASGKAFGIPSVFKKDISEIGTLVEIVEIAQVYPDGKMDIRIKGLKIFRILEIIVALPEKLYSGAIVNYPPNLESGHPLLKKKVLRSLRTLHELLKVSKKFPLPDEELRSYDLAHHAGLSLEEEYELLGLLQEIQRLEYLKRHLEKVIPVITGMENLKEKIQLNGHYRELKGFNFDF